MSAFMCASPCVPGAHGDQRLDPMDLELEMAVSHEVGCIAWWYHHQGPSSAALLLQVLSALPSRRAFSLHKAAV